MLPGYSYKQLAYAVILYDLQKSIGPTNPAIRVLGRKRVSSSVVTSSIEIKECLSPRSSENEVFRK